MKSPQALAFFTEQHLLLAPFVAGIPETRFAGILRDPTPQQLFHRLVQDIVGQQLSGKAANAIFEKLLSTLQTEQITPQHLHAVEPETLRAAGLSWAKVRAVLSAAELTENQTLQWEAIPHMPDQEVLDHLVQIRGVGPWTAEMFLLFTLGRPDVFSAGDLGLKKGIQNVYGLADMPTPQEALTYADSWKPFRSLASLALWWSLDQPDTRKHG